MKKTYVTNMPNHIGAFYKASKCFSELGINVTRVSYNKAVDSHVLFIDAEGEEDKLLLADQRLKEIGYIFNGEEDKKVTLLEFYLEDKPGSVTEVLGLIARFNLNISYISSQENGSGYQAFKMGLYVTDKEKFNEFFIESQKLCRVKIINYASTEKTFDNSIFYNSYVSGLVDVASLSEEKKKDLLVNVNLAMQTLDERGLSPYKTFDSIGRFNELLAECKGENFKPRITFYQITKNTKITLIEPDCGSNTAVIESNGERLFIDSGYACYRQEMLKIFSELFTNFKRGEEKIVITHADVDHAGLLNEFGEIIVSERTAECLTLESDKKEGFRESNPLHKPYVNICKILTGYEPVLKDKISSKWKKGELSLPIEQVGFLKVGRTLTRRNSFNRLRA